MLFQSLFSFELLIKTCAFRPLIDSAKQDDLNTKFPTRGDVQDCSRRIYYMQEMTLYVN